MFKCPKCGEPITSEWKEKSTYVCPLNHKSYKNNAIAALDLLLRGESIVYESKFMHCKCISCEEKFPAESLADFCEKYAHLWVDGEE